MAILAHLAGARLIYIHDLCVPIRGMPAMAAGAGRGVWIYCLPASQENVEMIIEVLQVENIMMALQTIAFPKGLGQFCRLDCGMGVKCQGVMRPEQLGAYPPGHALA